MKKKQIIGLSTLLLVCLLGLFTTSYANIYREFTENDFKNFLYNAWINNNTEEDVLSAIQTHENNGNITTIVDLLNQYDYCLLTVQTGSSGWNFVEIGLTPSDKHLYWYSNKPAVKNSDNCFKYQLYFNGLFQKTWGFSYSYEVRTNYIYYGMPRYQSSSSNTIVNSGGSCYPSTDIFDGPYQDALPFTFIPKPADEYADVYYFEDIPLYNASGEDLYIGQLFKPQSSIIEYWSTNNYYYRFGDWNFRDLTPGAFYMNYFGSDNNNDIYDVYLDKDYIYENTIYSTIWADSSTEPFTLAIGNFYIKNNYTSVVNGVIDPSNTFSGDYKDKYDNDIDNQEDINNISQAINDTINQPVNVSGELGARFSGDIYDIAGSMGFDSSVSIYFTFIEDFLKSVCNVLVDDDDVYFDYSIHGENPTRIYSSDICLPDGHPLKVFISIILVFLTVYLLYFQFMKLFEALQTANLSDAIKSQDVSFYIFKM